jgi:hypothetical protein
VSKKPSYSWAFFRHPYNQLLMLGTTAASVLASFPLGLDALALGLLALAAVEIVGFATVPPLASFQAAVDRANLREDREARRRSLLKEISTHKASEYMPHYEQMYVRVKSLYAIASDRMTSLTQRDVEQLDVLTIDYLAMCLSDVLIRKHDSLAVKESVSKKIKHLEQKLLNKSLAKDEEQQLRRAKAEYDEVMARQERMALRRSNLEASLISMPVKMEEVYQMVVTAPQAGNLSLLLEDSVAKLRVAEDVALNLDDILNVSPDQDAQAAKAHAATRAIQRANH